MNYVNVRESDLLLVIQQATEHCDERGVDGAYVNRPIRAAITRLRAACEEPNAKAEPESRNDGASLIAEERKRQMSAEGWTAEHDDSHKHGDLAVAAAILAVEDTDARVVDPLERDGWGLIAKHKKNPLRRMVIAGALIAAEIDRMLRRDGIISGPHPTDTREKEAREIICRYLNRRVCTEEELGEYDAAARAFIAEHGKEKP